MSYRPFRSKKKRDLGGFKSMLEKIFSEWMTELGIGFKYEPIKIPYVVPEKHKTYTPDFVYDPKSMRRISNIETLSDLEGKVIIETKGRLHIHEQEKLKNIKASNPHLDIRLVFPENTIIDKRRKGANGPFRYSDWAIKAGFKYHIGANPPKKWFTE